MAKTKKEMDWVVRQVMNDVSAPVAFHQAYALLRTLQEIPKGNQVMALGVAFHLICQRYNVQPQDIFAQTGRRIKNGLSEGRGEHIRAIQQYIKGEIG
jgi:hypothetical protein